MNDLNLVTEIDEVGRRTDYFYPGYTNCSKCNRRYLTESGFFDPDGVCMVCNKFMCVEDLGGAALRQEFEDLSIKGNEELSDDGSSPIPPCTTVVISSFPIPPCTTVVIRPEPLVPVGRAQRKGRSSQRPQAGEAVGGVGGHAGETSAFSVFKSPVQVKEEEAKRRNREVQREKRRQRTEEARSGMGMLLSASKAVEADSAGASAAGASAVLVRAPPLANHPVIKSVYFDEKDAGICRLDQERKKKPRTESAGQEGGEAASDAPFALHDVRVCAKCGKPCVDGKCCA